MIRLQLLILFPVLESIPGFLEASELWDASICGTDVDVLSHITLEAQIIPTVTEIVQTWDIHLRELLKDMDMEKGGTSCIGTKTGAYLKSEACIHVLSTAKERRQSTHYQ